jgi:cytochrome bd ubiquinol oxidase subunit I
MTDFPYYPLQDYGPLMKGLVIGGIGIFHVFLAQFAIGGGVLMCYFQWLAQTDRNPNARKFLDSYFRWLVLISFVLGALTGVGMWFTTIQISPRTIGVMVDEFHWLWATEYTFFWLEVIAGYLFYKYGKNLPDWNRMFLLLCYTIAGWFSLFWINGILSWQLTPGQWTETHQVWDGFFNPSFWPSLIFRTFVAMTIAALVAIVVINTMTELSRDERRSLIHRAAHLLTPLALMPFLGAWFLAVIPKDSLSWVLGGSVAMTFFLVVAVACSMLIGLYALSAFVFPKLYINAATASLLVALAFFATAGGEFVREGVRKPYTVRETLFSNSINHEEVSRLRKTGSVVNDPYPLKNEKLLPNPQLITGEKVYRLQCSVCHTMTGANGLVHLAGSWSLQQKRMNIAKLQYTKSFMPPFAGTAAELEALVQLLEWNINGRPETWSESSSAETLSEIQGWLDEAGVHPAAMPGHRNPPGERKK